MSVTGAESRGRGTTSIATAQAPARTATGPETRGRRQATAPARAAPSTAPATAITAAAQMPWSICGCQGSRPQTWLKPHSVASPTVPARVPAASAETSPDRRAVTA